MKCEVCGSKGPWAIVRHYAIIYMQENYAHYIRKVSELGLET
jgi:hypothetical protein